MKKKTKERVVRLDTSFYDKLINDQKRLVDVEQTFKTFSDSAWKVQAEMSRRLKITQDSNQNLSEQNTALKFDLEKVTKLAAQFALEKDQQARAMVKLVEMLNYAVDNYNKIAHQPA